MLFLSHLWMLCLFLNEHKKQKHRNPQEYVLCGMAAAFSSRQGKYLNIVKVIIQRILRIQILSANKQTICQNVRGRGREQISGVTRCKHQRGSQIYWVSLEYTFSRNIVMSSFFVAEWHRLVHIYHVQMAYLHLASNTLLIWRSPTKINIGGKTHWNC